MIDRIFIIFSFFVFVSLVYFIFQYIDVHPDALDAWMSSRTLQLNYTNHPIYTPLLIKLFNQFYSNPIDLLKYGALIHNSLAYLLLVLFVYFIFGVKQAKYYVILIMTMPITFGLSFILFHSSPMFFFLACFMLALARLIKTNNPYYLLLIAVILGLGFLTKIHFILMGMSLFILTFVSQTMRSYWKTWQIYLVPIIFVITITPYWLGYYLDDFENILYQYDRIASGKSFQWDYKNLLFQILGLGGLTAIGYYILSFILLFNPRFWLNTLTDKNPVKKNIKLFILIKVSITVVVFYYLTIKGAGLIDGKWLLIDYLLLFMLVIDDLISKGKFKKLKFCAAASALVGSLIIVLLFVHLIFDFNSNDKINKQTKFFDMIGWSNSVPDFKKVYQKHYAHKKPQIIVSRDYAVSATIASYIDYTPKPTTFAVKQAKRTNWVTREDLATKNLLFVCEQDECKNILKQFNKINSRKLIYIGTAVKRHPYSNYAIGTYDLYASEFDY